MKKITLIFCIVFIAIQARSFGQTAKELNERGKNKATFKNFAGAEEDFSKALKGKRIICLHIPDEYQYMDPELVELLKAALARHIELP